MNISPRLRYALKIVLLLLVIGYSGIAAILLRATQGLGGDTPKGEIADEKPRYIDYTNRVIPGAQTFWVIRRSFGDESAPAATVDLNALFQKAAGVETETKSEMESALFGRYVLPQERSSNWIISRRDEDGQMRDLAHIREESEIAPSLLVLPDGNTLLLLTGLERPHVEGKSRWSQTAVFRSDDQGKSWRWLEQGFLPEAHRYARAIQPYFHGANELWVWKDRSMENDWDDPEKAGKFYGELYYSPDLGKSSEIIPILESMPISRSGDVEVKPHVAQLVPDRAMIWLSHVWRGRNTTTIFQIELRRVNGRWQRQPAQRFEGMSITRLQERSGQIIAAISLDESPDGEAIFAFEREHLRWRRIGGLPNPFAPLPARRWALDLYLGDDGFLMLDMGSAFVTRWLYLPAWFNADKTAQISTAHTFYSIDQGRSWRSLSVSPIGFRPEDNRIFWQQADQLHTAVLGKP
jgi:hypothetical protein